MGLISYPTTANVITKLRNKFNIQTAIETGTFMGEATSWLAERFHKVITIDISKEFQKQAKERCNKFTNIEYLSGDSRNMLPVVMNRISNSCLFWLDAHNTIQVYGPGPDDCPLLEELTCIFASPFDHFIIVDDLNAFLPTEKKIHHPKKPLDVDIWPPIKQITELSNKFNYECYGVILYDVMAIVPKNYIEEINIDFYERLE